MGALALLSAVLFREREIGLPNLMRMVTDILIRVSVSWEMDRIYHYVQLTRTMGDSK
jgi:hypothetical protein